MFIVGLKRLERERGSGWLDCPRCHEHALQDVVDAMRFAALGLFRLAPVQRTRMIICRRCGFERVATAAEVAHLETMGRPLQRTWFVPFGALFVLLIVVLGYLVFAAPNGAGDASGISYVSLDTVGTNQIPLLHAKLDVPQGWEATFLTKVDDPPPPRLEVSTTSTGLEKIVLAQFTDSPTLAALVANHFSDQSSLQATGFPSQPPPATCVKLGGVPAARITIDYHSGGGGARIIMYAFFHGGRGYTLSYVASGQGNLEAMQKIAARGARTLTFTGAESPPSVSPSPSASASPGESASAQPGGSASAQPGGVVTASPSPAYTVNCH